MCVVGSHVETGTFSIFKENENRIHFPFPCGTVLRITHTSVSQACVFVCVKLCHTDTHTFIHHRIHCSQFSFRTFSGIFSRFTEAKYVLLWTFVLRSIHADTIPGRIVTPSAVRSMVYDHFLPFGARKKGERNMQLQNEFPLFASVNGKKYATPHQTNVQLSAD